MEETNEYLGGKMKRPRSKIVLKKPTKKALLLKRKAMLMKQMKHFGGFFEMGEESEAPSMPSMPPMPPISGPYPEQEGAGRRYKPKSKKVGRVAISPKIIPVRRPVRRPARRPARSQRFGGESLPGVETAANIFGNYFADPSLRGIANTSSNLGSSTGDVFAKVTNGIRDSMSSNGGRMRRPVRRSASPKRRRPASPKRRPASPKRRVAAPKSRVLIRMGRMLN